MAAKKSFKNMNPAMQFIGQAQTSEVMPGVESDDPVASNKAEALNGKLKNTTISYSNKEKVEQNINITSNENQSETAEALLDDANKLVQNKVLDKNDQVDNDYGIAGAIEEFDFESNVDTLQIDSRLLGSEKPARRTGSKNPPMKLNPLYIETKSKRLNLLVQPSLHDKIKAVAKKRKSSVNDTIHQILQEYLDMNDK